MSPKICEVVQTITEKDWNQFKSLDAELRKWLKLRVKFREQLIYFIHWDMKIKNGLT